MAEGGSVAQLEHDLKRFLGINNSKEQSNSASIKPVVLGSSNGSALVNSDQSQQQADKQPRKRKPRPVKPKSEWFPHAAPTNVEQNKNTVEENSMGCVNKKENTGAAAPKKQSNRKDTSDEPDRTFLAAKQQHFNLAKDSPGNKFAPVPKETRVYKRSQQQSNNGELPRNWRQVSASREALVKEKTAAVDLKENKSKQTSLPENCANNVSKGTPDQTVVARSTKPEPKKRIRSRRNKETSNEEAVNQQQGDTNASQTIDQVPRLAENPSSGIEDGPNDPKEGPLVLEESSNQVEATGEDGEEMVRVTVLPQPPKQPKQRKKVVAEAKSANAQPENEDSNGSSSGSSSSSEEENSQRPNGSVPLVFTIPKILLESFRKRGVLPLKHISPKFPRAIFHCRLCSFHVSSIPEVHRHMKDDRHVRLQLQESSRQTAGLMPHPPPEIVGTVEQFIQDIYLCSGLSKEDLEIRRATTEIFKNMIEVAFPGRTIRAYGSFVTELGLKASNVNVGLVEVSPEVKKDGLIIVSVLSWLQGPASTVFRYINDDLNCRTPVINFIHEQSGVSFAMVVESENAFKTSILLQQYRLIDPRFAVLTVAFRTFARICRLDQPDLGSLPAHAFTLMVLYYMQRDRVLPVLHELKASANEEEHLSAAEFFELKKRGEWTPRQMNLGQLWLGLLKFYAYSFTHNEHVVCVRFLEPMTRSSKNWGNRRIAIEDPFHQTVNIGAFMSTSQAFEFFIDCMRNLFHYFWIPQTAEGPLFVQLLLPGEGMSQDPMQCTPAEAVRRMAAMKVEDVKWDFQPDKILRSKRLPVICTVCSGDGHTKLNCTELEVPDVGFIPPPDFHYFALLDNVCWNIFRNFAQRDVDTAKRQAIQKELESFIKTEYPDAILTMFGSSCNGFGFADSDVDLCLTFESNADGKGLDFVTIVKKLGKLLKKNRFFCDIVPIHSAKVPIVKLRHRPTGLESDISVYNQLGRRNSLLLATYCAIDSRVRILGYMTKLLAKQCEIGDASRGSLSSYAYTLMVIHYLQQVKPPVIPVLQEITIDGLDRSKYIIEGWDTWFFENSKDLARVWPHHGANRESPSTLWLGFLLYYAKVFDYRLQVVTIRQMKPLYRLEKMWTDRPIAIEDPFDLSHNLGSGVSLRMGTYIRRVFVTARRFFQTPVRSLPPNFSSLEEYLFNPKVLIPAGPPPNDRGCLVCGKIGHKVKECPFRGGNRNKGRNSTQQPRENPQNAGQKGMHQRNPPQVAANRDRPVQQQHQMNRYRPEGQQINRDRPVQRQQQLNRYRPAQQNNRNGAQQLAGQPLVSRVFVARREGADPNQPLVG